MESIAGGTHSNWGGLSLSSWR